MQYGIVVKPEDYGCAQTGEFDYVELSGRAVAALDETSFDALRAQVSCGRIPCLGLNAYCPGSIVIAGDGFDLSAARVYAEHLARRAKALGVRVVGVGSPFSRLLPEKFDRAVAWRQANRFFQETARAFAPYGIVVCAEALGPCYCNFINRLEEAQSLIRNAAQPNLGLVLDFYNMEHSGEADIPLEPFVADIRHVHISDDAGDPQRRSYLKPEKLALHARRLRALRLAGYDGRISLEIDVPYDAREAARSLDMLKSVQ